MADQHSIFYDEWRDCLHSHYLYVLETGDNITEPTLRTVLVGAGVSTEMVEAWRMEAAERFGLEILPAPIDSPEFSPLNDIVMIESDEIKISDDNETAYPEAEIALEPEDLVLVLQDSLEVADNLPLAALEVELEVPPPPTTTTRSQMSLFGDDE